MGRQGHSPQPHAAQPAQVGEGSQEEMPEQRLKDQLAKQTIAGKRSDNKVLWLLSFSTYHSLVLDISHVSHRLVFTTLQKHSCGFHYKAEAQRGSDFFQSQQLGVVELGFGLRRSRSRALSSNSLIILQFGSLKK